MRFYAVSLAVLMLLGCASAEKEKITTLKVHPSVQDDPANRLLRLSYTNETNKTICLSASNWPSEGGIIDNDGDRFYLVVDDQKFYYGREMDYCPGCGNEVLPGDQIRGVLHYEAFGLPQTLFDRPKEMGFVSTAWICPRGLK